MPKIGLSDREWKERLSSYAQGLFEFSRGQRPPKGSRRAKELEQVDKCPKHRNPVTHDPFGRKIQCTCGHHQVKVSEIQ